MQVVSYITEDHASLPRNSRATLIEGDPEHVLNRAQLAVEHLLVDHSMNHKAASRPARPATKTRKVGPLTIKTKSKRK